MLTLRTQMKPEATRTTKRKNDPTLANPIGNQNALTGNPCREPVSGLYVRGVDMSNRCNQCNSELRLSRPQLGEQDCVCTCTGCGRLFILECEDPGDGIKFIRCPPHAHMSYVPESAPAVRLN